MGREEEESRRVVRNYLKDSVLSPVVSKVVCLERRQKGQGRVQEFALLRERREERPVSYTHLPLPTLLLV